MSRIHLELCFEDGQVKQEWHALPLEVGRTTDHGLALKSWRVAKNHAQIFLKEKQLFLQDMGSLGGCLLNGRRVYHINPIRKHDQIVMGPCKLRILAYELPHDLKEKTQEDEKNLAHEKATVDISRSVSPLVVSEHDDNKELFESSSSELVAQTNQSSDILDLDLRKQLHNALLKALDLRRNNVTAMHDEALRSEAKKCLLKIIQSDPKLATLDNQAYLCEVVLNEAVGLGPLEELLSDPSITEIMVNRYDQIYIEKAGKLQPHPLSFTSEQSVLGVIDRIVAPLGRRIDESSPMVDARLKDGSRVNAIIPPIALKGASLTIRKFPKKRPQMDDLIRLGSLDKAMAQFLSLCVQQRMNMLVSGGTGSGKTTLLNILSNCIPNGERIVTIEDAAELRLNHAHLVNLEARPANTEGRGQVTIRDLVKNALRMRPDRIVVGECRGGEAFDMLSAMNTGHEGSLTTLHANTPRDALSRLETMILMAGMDLPLNAIREHISSSIDFIIQQSRLSDGRRVISSIVEVGTMESGIIKIQEIFKFEKTVHAPQGQFKGCSIMPDSFERLRMQGIQISPDLFNHCTRLDKGDQWSL